MYRYFFIAKNNIKKQKSDMITFFVLSLIAALLIFVSVSFMLGTGRVYDTNKENINGADIILEVSDYEPLVAKGEEAIKGNVYFKNCERQRSLNPNKAEYRKLGADDWSEYQFEFCNYADDNKIQACSADVGELKDDEALIMASLKTTYDIGDTIQIKIGDNIYNYKVAGYVEDNIYGSPMNMSRYKTYVSDRMYEKLYFENQSKIERKVKIVAQLSDTAKKKHVDVIALSDEITDVLLKWHTEYSATNSTFISISVLPEPLMKTASLILPLIFVALILLFAIIIMIIAIIILDFSVKNFILTNMKNTAIMEATGYTVKELVLILLCQLLLIAGIGSTIGVIIGALLIDKLGVLILITLGLSWNQPVYPGCFFGVILGMCLVVAILTFALGREYGKTSVLDALRGGVNTHNYKKNLFAFDKTKMPIAVTMALKETFGKFRSQIGIVFIMIILSIASMVAFGMAENYGNDDGVLALSGIDECDAYCEGDDAMANAVLAMDTVDHLYTELGYAFKIYGKTSMQTPSIRVISDPSMIKGGCVIEGRWPKNPNEISLGSAAADRLGVQVGDTVLLKNNLAEESYIVSGISQSFNNMGMTGIITTEGAGKLTIVPESKQLSIFLKNGVTFEEFEKEFKSIYPDEDIYDYAVAVHQTVGTITIGMKGLAIFVAILIILIVAFVESLVVRTNINKQWRNLGVSKALGFTSKELVYQTMLSNIPAILMGILLGLLVSQYAGSKLLKTAFSIFGFKKVEFTIGAGPYFLTAIIITGVAMVTSAKMGQRIKTLEPVKMIMEE